MRRTQFGRVGVTWRGGGAPWLVWLALAPMGLASCAPVRESYFFRSADPDPFQRNYFKVTVTADSFASQSRYLAGYFEKSAVEKYFNEFAQPEGGRIFYPRPLDDQEQAEQPERAQDDGEIVATEDIVPIDPKLRDKNLVMVLSTNSDAVTEQIAAIADSSEMTNTLIALAGRERAAEQARVLGAIEQARLESSLAALTIEDYLAEIESAETAGSLREATLAFLNRLAASLGALAPFETIQQASDWIRLRRLTLEGARP